MGIDERAEFIKEFKEILHDHVAGIIAQNDAKNDVIMANSDLIIYKLDQIEIQTSKTNGFVAKNLKDIHDLQLENQFIKNEQEKTLLQTKSDLKERVSGCIRGKNLDDRVIKLENENVTMEKLRKMMIQLFASSAAIAAVIGVIYKIFFE